MIPIYVITFDQLSEYDYGNLHSVWDNYQQAEQAYYDLLESGSLSHNTRVHLRVMRGTDYTVMIETTTN